MVIPYLRTALIVTIITLAAGLWYSVRSNGALAGRAQVAEKALQQAQEQRKADAALLTRRQAEIVSERRKSATARQALSEALQASPGWAGTSVPPEVQSRLMEAL